MTPEEFLEENTSLRHALQTGIVYEQKKDRHAEFYYNNPTIANIIKHLRVGINAIMCEQAAIFHILVEKGIVTQQEMFDYSLAELRKEVKVFEERLSKEYNVSIKLG